MLIVLANSWLDSPMATCLSLTGTLGGESGLAAANDVTAPIQFPCRVRVRDPDPNLTLIGTFALMPRGWISRLKNTTTFTFSHDLLIVVFAKKTIFQPEEFFLEFANFKIHPFRLHPVLAWRSRMRPIYVT